MAQIVKLKRTSVAGRIPTTSHIEVGELAFNSNDKSLFIRGDSNAIVAVHDESTLHIDTTNNRIGIGNTSPSHLLHVTGADGSIANIVVNNDNVALRMSAYTNSHGEIRVETNHPLVFKTNGNNEHMRLDTGGRLIIATTSTAFSDKLYINNSMYSTGGFRTGTAATYVGKLYNNSGKLSLEADTNRDIQFGDAGTAAMMYIDTSTERVGIGTSTPSSILHIVGGSATIPTLSSSFPLTISNNGNSGLTIISSGTTNAGQINFGDQTDADVGKIRYDHSDNSFRFITNTAEQMRIKGNGVVGIGTTAPSTAKLVVQGADAGDLLHLHGVTGTNTRGLKISLGTDGATNQIVNFDSMQANGILAFKTAGTERMRIHDGGNVGIGTTSPSANLHIEDSGGATLFMGDTNGRNLRFRTANSGSQNTNISSYAGLHLGGGDNLNHLSIDGNGKVGIGTTAPQSLLHVSHATAPTFRLSRTGTGQIWVQQIDSNGRLHIQEAASEGGTKHTRLKIDDTGEITFNEAYTFPTSDGSANQVLQTDGSGNLSFATVQAGGGGTVSEAFKNIAVSGQSNVVADGATDTLTFAAGSGMTITTNASTDTVTFSAGTDFQDSDGDTKIQVEESSDEDIIRFDTAGSQRMMINASGRVGINTTALSADGLIIGTNNSNCEFDMIHTSGKRYRINNLANGNFQIENKTDGGTPLAITSAGRVAIGLTAPNTKFQVKSGGSDDGIYLVKSDNTNLLGGIIQTGSGDGALVARNTSNAQTVLFRGQGNNYITGGSFAIGHTSPSRLLHVKGSGSTVAAKIEATDGNQASLDLTNSEGAFRIINDSGGLSFHDDTDGATRLTINTSGNVGIGTTAPAQELDVLSSGNDSVVRARTPNANAGAYFHAASGTNGFYGFSLFHQTTEKFFIGGYGAERLGFWVGAKTTASNEKMSLDTSGRLGIGTTSPAGNLHIKSIGNVGDAILIVEADNDNNNEADNPRIELRQDGNNVAGYLYVEGTGGDTATNTTDNFTVLESKGTLNSQGIHFVTGGRAPAQSGGAANGTVRMTILGNGNVGIGTTGPNEFLHLSRAGDAGLKLHRKY